MIIHTFSAFRANPDLLPKGRPPSTEGYGGITGRTRSVNMSEHSRMLRLHYVNLSLTFDLLTIS